MTLILLVKPHRTTYLAFLHRAYAPKELKLFFKKKLTMKYYMQNETWW